MHKFLFYLICLISSLALVGCGGGPKPTVNRPTPDPALLAGSGEPEDVCGGSAIFTDTGEAGLFRENAGTSGCGEIDTAVKFDLGGMQTAMLLPRDVEVSTVESLYKQENVLVLDVREDWEYSSGHIPNAMWIPLGELPGRLNEVPQDKTVIIACASGNRSNQATTLLEEQGFDNVHNMLGGMNAWNNASYTIETEEN